MHNHVDLTNKKKGKQISNFKTLSYLSLTNRSTLRRNNNNNSLKVFTQKQVEDCDFFGQYRKTDSQSDSECLYASWTHPCVQDKVDDTWTSNNGVEIWSVKLCSN